MNVVQVFPNARLCNAWMDITDHQVARGTCANLIGDMPWKDKLPLVPANVNLEAYSKIQNLSNIVG